LAETYIKAPEPGIDIGGSTLPGLAQAKCRKIRRHKVALREKEFGIWQDVSWAKYYEHVKYLALGLAALGFEDDDSLAIIGDNRPEWVYAELAAQSLKGRPLGIYQDSILTEVAYVIDHSDACFVVAEDQEQADKVLDMKQKSCPSSKRSSTPTPRACAAMTTPCFWSTSPMWRSWAGSSKKITRTI
jgi:long-chain acyl-CoA synthetase